MKLPNINNSEEAQSLSSMTDVVFLLLIFFIVTMSGYVENALLETNLPTASSEKINHIDLINSLKIEITQNGEYVVNNIKQSPQTINRLLQRYARLMPDAEFLIQCSPESKHYMLVSILANLAKYNLKNVKMIK